MTILDKVKCTTNRNVFFLLGIVFGLCHNQQLKIGRMQFKITNFKTVGVSGVDKGRMFCQKCTIPTVFNFTF